MKQLMCFLNFVMFQLIQQSFSRVRRKMKNLYNHLKFYTSQTWEDQMLQG